MKMKNMVMKGWGFFCLSTNPLIHRVYLNLMYLVCASPYPRVSVPQLRKYMNGCHVRSSVMYSVAAQNVVWRTFSVLSENIPVSVLGKYALVINITRNLN